MTVFRVEMTQGQDIREVVADEFEAYPEWIIFYNHPLGRSPVEFWRVGTRFVVSVEKTKS